MSSSLDVWFIDYDFLLLSSGWGRKQPAKMLFHNIWHHSWQPWAGFTGQRNLLLPCQFYSNAIPHTLTSVQPATGLSKEQEGSMDGRTGGWGGKRNVREDWKTNLTAGRKTFWVLYHRCPSTADCSFGHPNVLAVKFEENTLVHTHAHRWCNWKNTIICFSLLRNLLSCFQPCTLLPCLLPSAVVPTVPTVNKRYVK